MSTNPLRTLSCSGVSYISLVRQSRDCESKGPVKGNLAVRAAALRGEDCSDKINTPDTNRDFIDNINPMQCGVEEVSGVLA